jgi:hypothetical protein
MNESRVAGRVEAGHHAVQFYGDETELFQTIGTFLSEGLVSGQPAIVIATPDHAAAIQDALSAHLIDVARARHLGDLLMLDAEETLATFMHNGTPDKLLFERHVGSLMEQAIRGRGTTPLRAYGEMVDVLWRRRQSDAAIRLEVMWNELASRHRFSLLCGYAIGNFYTEASKLDDVCRQHTQVFGPTMALHERPARTQAD